MANNEFKVRHGIVIEGDDNPINRIITSASNVPTALSTDLVTGSAITVYVTEEITTEINNNVVGEYTTSADFDAHITDYTNPHQVDATDVNLGNVDNTSDADKPISTATSAALDLKADATNDPIYDTVQLSGGTGTQGTMSWNPDEETIDIIQNGAVLQVGQELQYNVRNDSGSLITDGTPVMATGTIGASGRITIAPFDPSVDPKFFIGIVTHDIPNGEDGKVTEFGKIRGINTTAWEEDDILYLDPTIIGVLTNVEPTGTQLHIPVAIVISKASNGTIFVRVQTFDTNRFNSYTTSADFNTHTSDTTIHFTEGSIDHTNIQNIGTNTHTQIDTHISSTLNPHSVSASQIPNDSVAPGINVDDALNELASAITTNAGDLSNHTSDTTIHFTEASLDLTQYATSASISSVNEDSKEWTGFVYPNSTDIGVDYNATNRTITLTDKANPVKALWRSEVIPELVDGWVSTAHPTTLDTNYYLYYNGTSFVWSTSVWEFDYVQIAEVVYGTDDKYALRETHGLMPSTTHKDNHFGLGTVKLGGGTFTNYTLNSTVATNRRPTISETPILDEDITTTNAAVATTQYCKWHVGPGSVAVHTQDSTDFINYTTKAQYNDITTGTFVAMNNNYYAKVIIYEIPAADDATSQKYRSLWVQPQAQFGTIEGAQAYSPKDINWGDASGPGVQEYVAVGEIIVQSTSNNWEIVEVNTLSGSKVSQSGSGALPTPALSAVTAVGATTTDQITITVSGEASGGILVTGTAGAIYDSTYTDSLTVDGFGNIVYTDGVNKIVKDTTNNYWCITTGTTTDNVIFSSAQYCNFVINALTGTYTGLGANAGTNATGTLATIGGSGTTALSTNGEIEANTFSISDLGSMTADLVNEYLSLSVTDTTDGAMYVMQSNGVPRWAVPNPGSGYATQAYRSMLLGGYTVGSEDANADIDVANTFFDNTFIDCNTGTATNPAKPDLGIGGALQVIDGILVGDAQTGVDYTKVEPNIVFVRDNLNTAQVEIRGIGAVFDYDGDSRQAVVGFPVGTPALVLTNSTGDSGYVQINSSGYMDIKNPVSSVTNGEIDAIGNTALITKDYADPNYSGGTGDVVGPPSSSVDNIAIFDGITGKIIQDGGVPISDVIANTAKVTNATHTGEVTGATALTITNAAVTNAKMANMAQSTIKGRASGAGTGAPTDLTSTQVKTILAYKLPHNIFIEAPVANDFIPIFKNTTGSTITISSASGFLKATGAVSVRLYTNTTFSATGATALGTAATSLTSTTDTTVNTTTTNTCANGRWVFLKIESATTPQDVSVNLTYTAV